MIHFFFWEAASEHLYKGMAYARRYALLITFLHFSRLTITTISILIVRLWKSLDHNPLTPNVDVDAVNGRRTWDTARVPMMMEYPKSRDFLYFL